MLTRSKCGIFKPKNYLASSTGSLPIVPSNTWAALDSPKWKAAMQAEFQDLTDNHTWDLVPYDSTMKVINNTWIFKVKTYSDGSLDKVKVRLVA